MREPLRLVAGDVSGDGRADLVAVEEGPLGPVEGEHWRYMVGLATGDREFAWAESNLVHMSEPLGLVAGDLSRDGRADLVAVEEGEGRTWRYMVGEAEGERDFHWHFSNLAEPVAPAHLVAGDVTDDRRIDLVIVEPPASPSSED